MTNHSDTLTWLALPAFIGLALLVAAFGAQFEPGAWYAALEKPPWTPPNWVFAPVWTVLYVMIGVAGWLAWRQRHSPHALTAFASYAMQLLLNGLWSWLFFGLQQPLAGFFNILFLLAAIAINMHWFGKLSAAARWLLVPYLFWVLYATTLNGGIVLMN